MPEDTQLKIDGVEVRVSNLNKIFYPKTGFTKGEMIDYYIRVSKFLLPHLRNRPITLKRYPNGVEGLFFYEKQCPANAPKSVETVIVAKSGGEINYCELNNLPSLVWAANLANLELHTFLHQAPAIGRPTSLAFDLDPGAPADILTCGKVALRLKAILDALRLESFPKTSGSKGMQIYVPLNTPVNYERSKGFARRLAQLMERQFPDLVIARMEKVLRKGKVFMDWSQNDDKKTTVNVYSLRAKDRPMASTPVTWKEVEAALKKKDPSALSFEAEEVIKRVEKMGDLFAPVLSLKQKLPAIRSLESIFSPESATCRREL
jgi:bifunctional non-homologous end joining protein LigD